MVILISILLTQHSHVTVIFYWISNIEHERVQDF